MESSIEIKPDDYYFIFNKNTLKNRLHIASAFHKDCTLWSNGKDFVELVNNQDVKICIRLPVLKTNIKEDDDIKNFFLHYNIESQSLKGITCDNIILVYSNSGQVLRVCGYSSKNISIKENNYIESISHNEIIDDDPLENCDEYNDTTDEISLFNLENTTITIKTTFVDIYPIENSETRVYHTISINQYIDTVGMFIIAFQDFINFINKANGSKCSKIKIHSKNDNIELVAFGTINLITNTLVLSYIKNKEFPFESFDIDMKFIEPLKSINIAMTSNKKKDKKIYNDILFEIIKKDNKIIGLNIKPNNIKDELEYLSQECFFIFIPTI